MPIKCYHLLNIEQSPSTLDLVKAGKLKIVGCGMCDWRLPKTMDEAGGQDVTCVGPNSSDCPDPKSAKIV